MVDTEIKRYSLSHQVCDKLEEMIKNGEYEIGKKIPTEVELMAKFNVSRNTIREAVKSLSSLGILEVKQGDGTYVKNLNRFDANMKEKYDKANISDITEARLALELSIVYLAAMRRTEEDLINIHFNLISRKTSKHSVKENTTSDINFHMAIALASHNEVLIDLYKSIYSYLENYIFVKTQIIDENCEKIDQLHDDLYFAIKNQNPKKAQECVYAILNF